jgi:hypothetical protein
MAKRFIRAFVMFVGIVFSFTFAAALVAAPAAPVPQQQQKQQQHAGCDRSLATAQASMSAMQARVQDLKATQGSAACKATRLYFLELVKTRAVTAVCINGADRDRALGRLDADVERINHAIAKSCG